MKRKNKQMLDTHIMNKDITLKVIENKESKENNTHTCLYGYIMYVHTHTVGIIYYVIV